MNMKGLRLSLVAAAVSFGCGNEAPVSEPPLRPVRFVEVHAAGAERTRTFAGVAEADVESTLSFRVGGNIKRLLVRTGDAACPRDWSRASAANQSGSNRRRGPRDGTPTRVGWTGPKRRARRPRQGQPRGMAHRRLRDAIECRRGEPRDAPRGRPRGAAG